MNSNLLLAQAQPNSSNASERVLSTQRIDALNEDEIVEINPRGTDFLNNQKQQHNHFSIAEKTNVLLPQMQMTPSELSKVEEIIERAVFNTTGLASLKQETIESSHTPIGSVTTIANATSFSPFPSSSHHYKEADQLWIQAEQAWEERTMTQQKAQEKRIQCDQAHELLKKVQQVRENTDLQKTILGRISRYAGKAAVPLSFVPAPVPLAGIAHSVSGVAHKINQIWVDKDVMAAEREV
ncbi:MAG TPA: hypothetical protein VJK54_07545, partial [Chthoniobacterales bacterium]|nr:hypothetical protein [Chthoniobacterales bacterium]